MLHTQATLAYKAVVMAGAHGLDADDCVLMPAPCAHISGLLNGITLPGVVPFRSVFMARWDPATALDLIESERVTFMVGPPTFFRGLMDAPTFRPERVASLRLVSSGGAGVSEAFVAEATERLGARVKRTYGSTEAPTVITEGRTIAAAEARVSRRAASSCCAAPRCASATWPRPTTTARSRPTAGSAPATSRRSRRGVVEIVGRLKDVIIRGGENIAAAEVEDVLEAHPAVRHAVAVGYPDELMGERVAAFVEADAGVRRRRGARVVRGAAASPRSRHRSASSCSTSCRCSPPASPTVPRYAVRSSQGEVSTPIILKPFTTAFGFSVPGFQSWFHMRSFATPCTNIFAGVEVRRARRASRSASRSARRGGRR